MKILSFSHTHKPDLRVTHSSPLCTWLSALSFFSMGRVMAGVVAGFSMGRVMAGVLGQGYGGDNIAIVTALILLNSVFCIVFKYSLVYGFYSSYFLCLPGTSVSGC